MVPLFELYFRGNERAKLGQLKQLILQGVHSLRYYLILGYLLSKLSADTFKSRILPTNSWRYSPQSLAHTFRR